jgi:Flp pilus assembly protein TadB
VTTIDLELAAWRRDWSTETEPLPELKRKIRRQNLRITVVVAALCVCLALSTIAAVRTRSSFMAGLATGMWFASLSLGSYAWWVRRGAWRPTAQTTLAYLELSYRRAIARARTLRFSFYFLLAGIVLSAAFFAWNWQQFTTTEALILAALVAELFFFSHKARRNKQEIKEMQKLLEQTKESLDVK